MLSLQLIAALLVGCAVLLQAEEIAPSEDAVSEDAVFEDAVSNDLAPAQDETCADKSENCAAHKKNGRCENKRDNFDMRTLCRKTCKYCGCEDKWSGGTCRNRKNLKRCHWKFGYGKCRMTCGFCKVNTNGVYRDAELTESTINDSPATLDNKAVAEETNLIEQESNDSPVDWGSFETLFPTVTEESHFQISAPKNQQERRVKVCKTADGGHVCKFPFKYKGNWYNSCKLSSDKTHRWCATQTTVDNKYVEGEWGYCSSNSCTKPTRAAPYCSTTEGQGSATLKRACIFPFVYRGVSYNQCTNVDSDVFWCATQVGLGNQYISDKWSAYCDRCIGTGGGNGWGLGGHYQPTNWLPNGGRNPLIQPKPAFAPCANNPCKNGGGCRSVGGNSYQCICQGGWTGSSCTTAPAPTPCAASPCKNAGVCTDLGSNKYSCKCPKGWEGPTCSAVAKTSWLQKVCKTGMHLTKKECFDQKLAVQFVRNSITKGDSFLKGAKDNQVYPQSRNKNIRNKGLPPGCMVKEGTGYIHYNNDLVGSPRKWYRNICKDDIANLPLPILQDKNNVIG